jgi:hypothetical protein
MLFSAAMLAPIAASAYDQPMQGATAQPATASSNQKICRQMIKEGMVTHVECHTAREWNSMRSYEQREFKEMQARETVVPRM